MIKTIRCPIYNYDIVMVTSKADLIKVLLHEWEELYDRDDLRNELQDCDGEASDGCPAVMYVRKSRTGDLAHEAHHVANIILDWAGVKRHGANDEAQAYLEGWIVDQFRDPKGWERADKCVYLNQ